MRTDEGVDQRVYRKDYQAPAWWVDGVELAVDLSAPADAEGAHPVTVRCKQMLRARSGQAGPLRLDGRDMELLEIRVDGQPLPPSAWSLDAEGLSIPEFPAQAELETVGRLQPFRNASLEGLYGSAGLLCTQCEAHGFSRISWFQDRPDVLSTYRVEITADPQRYPVLLSNGNRLQESESDGLRTVVWEDPHPKPCYLFALVAGRLACVRDGYTTSEGRQVAIEFWCDPGLEGQLGHAVQSLKHAMRFDEQAYGRAYDLDLYMVVVARAFNMGAMENKGLNIFNPKCVLAHPETATDEDHVLVEAVVAHEYLHNWTGNRITCRDWFQLSLKEGLTVYREQDFSAAHAGGSAQRIQEVALLKSRQFVEDAGPLAHPVRPASYVDMNNFYTLTVYEKGAELVRVLRALVGEQGFASGLQSYFDTHDGRAATVEDFLSCFARPDGAPLVEPMLRWYDQQGTPRLLWQLEQPGPTELQLTLQQEAPERAGKGDWQPVPIPLQLVAVDAQGLVPPEGEKDSIHVVLEQAQASLSLRFARPLQAPYAVIPVGGFPAPVLHEQNLDTAQLRLCAQHVQDPVARWEAQQALYREALSGLLKAEAPPPVALPDMQALAESGLDAAVLAEMLSLPCVGTVLAEQGGDPAALARAYAQLDAALAAHIWAEPASVQAWLQTPDVWRFDVRDNGRRRLALRVLSAGLRAGRGELEELAWSWLREADNLSQRLGATQALWEAGHATRAHALQLMSERHAQDPLVLDRLYALRARFANTDEALALLVDPGYQRTAPNRVRAVLDTLARRNLPAFYAADGAVRSRWCAEIVALDGINPQLTARLLGALEIVDRLDSGWRERLRADIEALRGRVRAPAVHEQLGRLLGIG
ncbi:MAG: aminopeptidase N [Oceanococcaceae bacterium]